MVAMTPRRFTVTSTREAMAVTADSLDEVAQWCGGEVVELHWVGEVERCVRPYPDAPLVRPGDVLVTDGTRWWDVSAEEFERESAQWEERK